MNLTISEFRLSRNSWGLECTVITFLNSFPIQSSHLKESHFFREFSSRTKFPQPETSVIINFEHYGRTDGRVKNC